MQGSDNDFGVLPVIRMAVPVGRTDTPDRREEERERERECINKRQPSDHGLRNHPQRERDLVCRHASAVIYDQSSQPMWRGYRATTTGMWVVSSIGVRASVQQTRELAQKPST
jgi:hypothetical protein